MEADSSNKLLMPYTDNVLRDGTLSAVSSSQWHNNHIEHRRNHVKNRDRSTGREWNRDRNLIVLKMKADTSTKSRMSYTDYISSNGTPSAVSSSQWHHIPREHGRDHSKNREPSRERDWIHGRNREHFEEEENRKRFKEETQQPLLQQQPAPTFPSYEYNALEHYNVDNRRTTSVMPTYNLISAMNSLSPNVKSLGSMGMSQNLSVNPTASGIPITPGLEMESRICSNSSIHPFAFIDVAGDNNMFGMMRMGNFCQFEMMNSQGNVMIPPVKEIIYLSKSVLYPPNPNAPLPTTGDKPPGCKTVFVGGLPENATEEIIKEVFERCGDILTIRIRKKNFCYIRFASEAFVESAILLSGYRIRIENKNEAAYTGKLRVDYAQARDDQYEYECQRRALQREARHRERSEQEYCSSVQLASCSTVQPPTQPPVLHYSDHKATTLSEKLRGGETFQEAASTLITWLERGECSKKNAGFFYSMIQSTNSHVRSLMNEKEEYENKLDTAKKMLKQKMQGILLQFNDIEKIFKAACLQKVSDHFTKAQKKNIKLWKKQTEDIKNACVEEVLNARIEDEMDVSDDEDSTKKSQNDSTDDQKDALIEELNKLREESDSLRCQLEASQNEMMLIRTENEQEKDLRERQFQAMRQILHELQKEFLLLKQKRNEVELKELHAFTSRRENLDKDVDFRYNDIDHFDKDMRDNLGYGTHSSRSSLTLNVVDMEARLIGLISTFLNLHPFGASVD